MTPRAALLATTSAAGLLVARGLDGLGLLPWVSESEAVRRAAADPRWTALGLLGCLVLGRLAARCVRWSPLLATAVLMAGQLALLVGLEELAREVSGAPEEGGETGLVVAVAVQLLLSVLAVTTALLVLRLAPHPLSHRPAPWTRSAPLPAYRVVVATGPRDRPRGRSPPVGSSLRSHRPTRETHDKDASTTRAGCGRSRPVADGPVGLRRRRRRGGDRREERGVRRPPVR